MRKFIISFCLLLAAVATIQAASLRGLRIESTGQPIIVFVDGTQVCTATSSCFVANLPGGNYKVEVYEAVPGRRGDTGIHTGNLLYSEYVRYSGRNIFDITVNSRSGSRPDSSRDDRPDRRDYNGYYDVMSPEAFGRFYNSVKNTPFDDQRIKLIDTALVTSNFTTDQCRQLTGFFTFDDKKMQVMQMMYPNIMDKSNFFTLIETLTFISSKDKMNEFVKKWHGK